MTTPPPDKSPDRITPGKAMEAVDKPITQPTPSGFQSYMQETPGQAKTPPAPQAPGASEVTRTTAFQTAGPTFDTLIAQARGVQDSLGTVQEQLNNQNLRLKRSQTHLVKNKLTDSNEMLRAAGAKLGVGGQPMKSLSGMNPIERFIAYVNDGQDQLFAVQEKLKEIAASNQELRPGDMMYLQVKMGQAQQEIEYTSTLLGKVITSITQVLNTQL